MPERSRASHNGADWASVRYSTPKSANERWVSGAPIARPLSIDQESERAARGREAADPWKIGHFVTNSLSDDAVKCIEGALAGFPTASPTETGTDHEDQPKHRH